MAIKLDTSAASVADATGTATASLTIPPWQLWRVNRYSVRSTSTLASSVRLYRGTVSDASFIDGTTGLGNQNTGSIPIDLYSGDALIAQWTGCTVGATCRLIVSGIIEDIRS